MLCLPFLIIYAKPENNRAVQLRLHTSPELRIYVFSGKQIFHTLPQLSLEISDTQRPHNCTVCLEAFFLSYYSKCLFLIVLESQFQIPSANIF